MSENYPMILLSEIKQLYMEKNKVDIKIVALDNFSLICDVKINDKEYGYFKIKEEVF